MDLTDSVSGDSSDEDTPPKKKHRTTTRRGLSALLDNNSNLGTAPAEKSSVYSSRVSSVMGSMRLGQGQLSMAGVTGSLKVPPQADSGKGVTARNQANGMNGSVAEVVTLLYPIRQLHCFSVDRVPKCWSEVFAPLQLGEPYRAA